MRYTFLTVFALVLIPMSTSAAPVYINGLPMGSLKAVSMQNCTVVIDAAGGVNILAPNFSMPGASQPTPAASPAVQPAAAPVTSPTSATMTTPPVTSSAGATSSEAGLAIITQNALGGKQEPVPPPVTNQAFVIATSGKQAVPLPLEFQFFVNGEKVHQFTARDIDKIYDITAYLKKGPNQCKLTVYRDKAFKHGSSYDPNSTFSIKIQVGNAMGAEFSPVQTLVEIVRSGAQLQETEREFTLTY